MEKRITLNKYDILGKKVDIDLSILKNNEEIEEVLLKNIEVDNQYIDILNSIKNLKKLWFVNCFFYTDERLKKIEYLRLDRCRNFNRKLFNQEIKYLYISNCESININDIKTLELIVLGLEKEKVINLKQIESFCDLEKLYLKEIELSEEIDYNVFKHLKKVNFNGSKVKDKEEFLKKLEGKNFEISFKDKNLKIG